MTSSPLTIGVLGATGGTGRSFVEQALRQGHSLRALVRKPSQAVLPREVKIIDGSITEIPALQDVVRGSVVIVSCLGAPLRRSYGPRGLVGTVGMRNLISVMRTENVRRLIAVSAFGAAESYARISLPFRILMATALRGIYADKDAMEPLIRASSLEWTIVRPANLTNASPTGRIAINPAGTLGFRSRIARGDVAGFLLRAAVGAEFTGETPIITNC